MTAKQRRERIADELAGRTAEHRAHARTDIADAILGIDLPQPADAALLIFLEEEACALALAADVGIGLELVESPARDAHDAGDRHPEREQDRQHVLERDAVTSEEERAADARSEGDHPRHRALRNDHQPESGDAKPGHDRSGDNLRAGIELREEIEGHAEKSEGADRDIAHQLPI